MKESLHYLLMADHFMIQKALVTSVKDTGLTSGQPKVLDYLKKHAPSVMSPILCTELTDNQKISLLKEGEIEKGEPLFAVNIYE